MDDRPEWLADGELPASPLGDLKPSVGNRLSVWEIEDGEGNLQRIIAALAARSAVAGNRNHLEKFDCTLIDGGLPGSIDIGMEKTPGISLDHEANERWHRHLTQLTVSKVAALVDVMAQHGERRRYSEEDVTRFVGEAVKAGWIDIGDLPPVIAQAVTVP